MSEEEIPEKCGAWYQIYVWPVVAIIVGAILLLAGCGTPQMATSAPPPPDTVRVESRMPVTSAATASAPAVRIGTVTDSQRAPMTTEVDLCGPAVQARINGLEYRFHDSVPVWEAYHAVADCLGWGSEVKKRWGTFIVEDVIFNESVSCWNVKGGAVMQGYMLPCDPMVRQGSKEDSGFFQLTWGFWYGPEAHGCVVWGTCSSAEIIASPWSSMMNGMLAVMYDGRRPWCYDEFSRNFHRLCSTVPRYWPG